jgi:MoxR-like ATPase
MFDLDFMQQKTAEVTEQVGRVVVGQEEVLRSLLVAVYTQGHALLEGVPGTAKTLMVRALARAMRLEFGRIQFTPDLMPSDVVGTNIFDLQRSQFTLRKGPVFTDLLLGDEINRSPAKTQAALLEAMQERRCTIDGAPYELTRNFTVFATQNPIEYEGTYPLPEAQLDRFMMKVLVTYPHPSEEERILELYNQGQEPHNVESSSIQPVMSAEDIDRCRAAIKSLTMRAELVTYIRELITATRQSDDILVGAGPRGGIHLLLGAKATAAFAGRDFVTPDDIQTMVPATIRHRIILQPEAEANGLTSDDVLRSIMQRVPVPR